MEFEILNQGERIKKIRKELNINQDELGGKKFSKNYISMFENNKRQINPINAAFLARRINEIARMKNKSLEITASYFLKTEEDLAKEKCEEWINQIKNNYEFTTYERLSVLYKIIEISNKFNLKHHYAEGLFLKGLDLLNRQLYYCSITNLLLSINYFHDFNDYVMMLKAYKYLGIIYFDQEKYNDASLIFNTAHSLLNIYNIEDEEIKKDIVYFEEQINKKRKL